ncbi:MAG: hypothetical protein OEW58_08455 [Gammaproteobacteria bacterium]|nr:hypothetical protein [Gammaproteobacteria bacterium]
MKSLATYIMRGQMQAALVTMVFAALSLVLAPFSYVSGGIIALVTLRNGAQAGLVVAAIAGLAMAALSMWMIDSPLLALIFALVVWLPVWILALVLRRSISLALTMAVGGLLGLLAVIGMHVVLGDTVGWWQQVLDKVLADALNKQALDLSSVLGSTAQLMTAIMASAFLLSATIALFLGRWWQALLYNPGGFGKEFNELRLDKTGAVLTVLVTVWAVVGGGIGSLAADMAIVSVALYAVSGLALLHCWTERAGVSGLWLLGVYVLLMFFLPQLAVLLALAGLADAWVDLRRFIKAKL